jgi:membrane-bound ClpP family serine protease
MEHSAGAEPAQSLGHSTLSLPWLVAAALLIGGGLFVISYFILTFQLVYLAGIAMVVVGGLMLFDPRAGPDHA